MITDSQVKLMGERDQNDHCQLTMNKRNIYHNHHCQLSCHLRAHCLHAKQKLFIMKSIKIKLISYTMEQLSPKSTQSNINLIQSHPHSPTTSFLSTHSLLPFFLGLFFSSLFPPSGLFPSRAIKAD